MDWNVKVCRMSNDVYDKYLERQKDEKTKDTDATHKGRKLKMYNVISEEFDKTIVAPNMHEAASIFREQIEKQHCVHDAGLIEIIDIKEFDITYGVMI